MSKEARQFPKFPWDYDVPNNAFWNSLDYKVGRNFFQCYTESEIAEMTFDGSLPTDEKLRFLRSLLHQTLAEKEARASPTPFHDVDYKSWMSLKFALSTMERYLGNPDAEEALVRETYENGPNGTKNMSALHSLSGIMEDRGKYAEAECMANQVLPWMQRHELLGHDSPQALGSMKILTRSIWKQGRYEDVEKWIKRCRKTVEAMRKGKFAKYYEEEKEMVDGDIAALEMWKAEREGLGRSSTKEDDFF